MADHPPEISSRQADIHSGRVDRIAPSNLTDNVQKSDRFGAEILSDRYCYVRLAQPFFYTAEAPSRGTVKLTSSSPQRVCLCLRYRF